MAEKLQVDDINQAFTQWELNPHDILWNGKVQRVGSIWYIATKTLSYKDKPIFMVTIGDWRTGEKKHYWSKENVTPGELLVKTRPYNEQKYDENLRASREAWHFWKTLRLKGTSSYLRRKHVDIGLLHYIRHAENKILIPVLDVFNHLWGLQSIYNLDGTKRFFKNQRVNGCLHFIEGDWPTQDRPTILLTEGYATGCSLKLATVLPVCVAFHSSNLWNAAHNLKQQFPWIKIIIASDNDWKTVKNPGVSYAVQTFLEYGEDIFWPSKDEAGDGTDWNDVHHNLGIHKFTTIISGHIGENHVRVSKTPLKS